MQEPAKFEIRIPGWRASTDDSVLAGNVPASELPLLSHEEHAVAQRFGMSDEAYRRQKLASYYGQQRKQSRAMDLGRQVESVLECAGEGYRLASINWNSDTLTWRLEIETPEGRQNVVLSWELVDDALDARTPSELRRIRNMVMFGLGRRDLIFEKRV